MTETPPMPMCPMAEMCRGMMAKPSSMAWMILPGVVLIGLGTAIIFFPQILAGLVALALIGMGLGMLVMMNFMRTARKRLGDRPG